MRKCLAVLCAAVLVCLAAATAASAAEDPAASMYEPGSVGVVYLTLSPAEQAKLEAEPEEYVEGTFSFAETDGTPGGVGPATTPIKVGIRLKGQLGSKRSLSQKAAFKLKVNWVKGQKFRGLKKMTLNNMVQDPSEIHETLTYQLFRDAGVAASRTGFAYVYLNGIDYGMHLNIETLDDVALEKRFGAFKHLYEGGYGSDVETGAADTPAEVTAAAKKFEVDEGDEANISDLEGLIATVNDPAGGDFSQRIETIADLKEMTRMWAVEKYVGHWDGYAGQEGYYWPNNYYLFSNSQGRFSMLPWGTDQTWGSRLGFTGDAGILFDKCLADQSCAQMYVASLRELQRTVEGAGLDPLATRTAALLKPWEEKEQGNGSHHEHGIGEIEGAVQSTRNFIAVRPGDLSSFLASQPKAVAAGVKVALQAGTLTADGASTTTATATVTDAEGEPLSGETVTFTSSDPGEAVGPVTDHGDGTYTAVVTASKALGAATITATDSSVTPAVIGTATLTQVAGPVSKVALALAPPSILADGTSSTTATATLTDAAGNPVPGNVTFASSDPGEAIGPVTAIGEATYTATITASTAPGTATITATDTSAAPPVLATATLTQTAPPAAHVSLSLAPSSILADGTSSTTATATLTDAAGNPVRADTVTFASSDPGEAIGPVIVVGDGTYIARVTASTAVGTATITATDTAVSPSIAATATLTQTAPPPPPTPPNVSIAAAPPRISAQRTPTFRFAAEGAGVTFRCRIDNRPPVACTSPYTSPILGYGLHQFQVTAVNSAGQAGRSASYLFLVVPAGWF